MARILWIADSAPGSFFPAVPLVQGLRDRGHELTALCDGAGRQQVLHLGCQFSLAPEFEPAATTDRAERVARWLDYARRLFAATSEELGSGYDAVLADPLALGGGFAAEAQGVPWCSYVHFAMDETAADTPFRFHLWDGSLPADEAFRRFWNEARGTVGLGPEMRPAAEHVWWRHSPDLTLVLGIPELVHPKGALPAYVKRIGPALWMPPAAESPEELDRLGANRPALLASVSTLRDADLELVRLVADAALREGWDVVATVPGGAQVPALPANVTLAGFVSHDLLLPRVRLVASHAGYGTVTRAAAAGVPMLLFPDGRDRHNAARGAVAAGIALSLTVEERNPESVAAALRELIHDGSYARRALEIAAVARRYDAAAACADAIEQLIASRRAARGTAPR